MKMEDNIKQYKATPFESLEKDIMSSCISKSEREWWAKRKIEELQKDDEIRRLEGEKKQWQKDLDRLDRSLDVMKEFYEKKLKNLRAVVRGGEERITPQLLHRLYLEATKSLTPESYNPNAQKSYSELTDEQKQISIFIADKVKQAIAEAGEESEVVTKAKTSYMSPEEKAERDMRFNKYLKDQKKGLIP